MPNLDATALRLHLPIACRKSFAEIRANHPGESFYCMGLFTCGSYSYLLPTAMTEEGLNLVAQKYRSNPRYADQDLDRLRFDLRWSPCDSPLHLEGSEHFSDVESAMREISETIYSIDIDRGWEEFEEYIRQVTDTICEVLSELDREGVFGAGLIRQKTFVSILMGDQDDSILHIGRRLNPTATFEQFENEWKALCDYWTSR